MQEPSHELNRRTFMKSAGLAAGAAAVTTAGTAFGAAPADKTIRSESGLPTRAFGKTGHTLPVLGHGGSAMVDSWATAYNVDLEPHEKRIAMVRSAYDMGIRYFDTARVYGESEGIMGEALKDVRDDVYIATKMHMPMPEAVRKTVETSLEQLKTDYADCVQIHSPAIERVGAKGAMKLYEELEKLRDEGLVRFIGLTTHVAFEDVFTMIDTGNFDQVLLAAGYMRRGMDTMLSNENIEWREKCLARAAELDMAIVAMKVMGLNMLGRGSGMVVADYDEEKRKAIPGAAMRYVLNDPRISMLNVGVSSPDDLAANVASLKGDTTFTDKDKLLLADYANLVYKSDYVNALEVV